LGGGDVGEDKLSFENSHDMGRFLVAAGFLAGIFASVASSSDDDEEDNSSTSASRDMGFQASSCCDALFFFWFALEAPPVTVEREGG
jgi:hypothetical protein